MRTYHIPIRASLIACVAVAAALGGVTVKAEGLELSLCTVETNSVIYTNNNIEVALTFTNNGTYTVALLKHFTPLPIFFEFKIVKADGTVIAVPGSGKISFYESSMQYVKLEEGNVHVLQISLADVLKEQLESGTYSVSVIYKNQYGSDCFKGKVESNQISIQVDAEAFSWPPHNNKNTCL